MEMVATPAIMPRYEIEEVPDAVVMQRVYRYEPEKDDEGKIIRNEKGVARQVRKEEVVNIAEGKKVYNVYFPQGHSIQVVGEQSLKDLNLDGDPKLVDMNSGEEVPEGYSSIKALVASKTRSRRLPK
jgi:hypothetical protein